MAGGLCSDGHHVQREQEQIALERDWREERRLEQLRRERELRLKQIAVRAPWVMQGARECMD